VVAFPGALDGAALFDVPANMCRVFDADCAAAGIVKRDGAGRVVDVHALRHSFGTMLARAGVPLQLAQKAMRHSTPVLTANVYTHLGLMDVAGAVERLPGMRATMDAQQAKKVANSVTPNVTPESDISCQSGVTKGNITAFNGDRRTEGTDRVLSNKDGASQQGAIKENGAGHGVRTRDIQLGKLALYQLS
jgi:hypothetical protein